MVAIAAYFPFKLRARVDLAEQWWKQLNVAVDRGLPQDPDSNKIGGHILETLQSRQPPTRPERWVDHRINPSNAGEMKDYRKALAIFKGTNGSGGKLVNARGNLPASISDTPAFRALSRGWQAMVNTLIPRDSGIVR